MVSGPIADALLPASAVSEIVPVTPAASSSAALDLVRIAYYRQEHIDYPELRNELLRKVAELQVLLTDLLAEPIDMSVPDKAPVGRAGGNCS